MTILSTLGKTNVDYIINVDDNFFSTEKLEKGNDNIVDHDNLLRILKNFPLHQKSAGGSAANTAAGFAVLGGQASFHGCVGSDPQGEFYIKSFEKHGIACCVRKQQGKHTPSCLCLISLDGEVSYVISDENIASISRCGLDKDTLLQSHIIHAECNLGRTMDGIGALFECASLSKKAGGIFSLVLPSHNLVLEPENRKHQQQLVEQADILFGNKKECESFFGADSINDLVHISRSMRGILNVTLGIHGAAVISQGNIYQLPATPTRMVNAVGAGDNFASGFLFTYQKAINNFQDALHSAISMGKRAVTTNTGRLAMDGPR